jgi:beta-glucosidase/6-phospho-beta-glucosidase/beta-galactosidase
MIRIVSFPKALAAGALGALAWEAVLRLLLLAGLPVADLVRLLGRLLAPHGPAWVWWAAGLSLHLVVGMLWAVFYAYIFWSLFVWRPVVQGLVFALLPLALAELIMYPQLKLMQAGGAVAHANALTLLATVGWGERAGLVLGHLAYGAVLGAIYTRPVGYRVSHSPKRMAKARPLRAKARPRPPSAFMFATGIECSYPTLEKGRWRCDQMAATGHYANWPRDLELAAEVGVSHLRYGPPLHLICRPGGRYEWDWTDGPMQAMREIGLVPIVDLCHFGLPDWLETFQNEAVPEALTAYAAAFADRYPWVRYYTPVNEMYVCARFSALDGMWNEQLRDERAFVRAVGQVVRASIGMMDAVLQRRGDAVFVTSESSEFFQAASADPEILRIAAVENERRFLPLDLLYARRPSEAMCRRVIDHGLGAEALDGFLRRTPPRRIILGVDYYDWNEKLIDTKGRVQALGELFGWYVIAKQYYDRYRRPMMHTETNHLDAREAPRWLWRQWHNVQLIQQAGVPVVGFTWYSLTDQTDWDIALVEALGNVNPVGLFDLNRDPRMVAESYRRLIDMFQDQPNIRECQVLEELLR